MKIKALTVDDEAPARGELSFILNQLTDQVAIVGEAANGLEALQLVEELQPDVLFVDIHMPLLNGLELAKLVVTRQNPPEIIFVTAYDRYAIDAFEVNAIDYLLKPISEERLKITIDRLLRERRQNLLGDQLSKVLNQLNLHSPKKLPVNSKNGRIRLIDLTEIYYAYTNKGKVFVKTEEGDFETCHTLRELEEMIESPDFFRCHRCYLVNLNYIREVIPWFRGNYYLIMDLDGQMEIPVGRTKVDELKRYLNL